MSGTCKNEGCGVQQTDTTGHEVDPVNEHEHEERLKDECVLERPRGQEEDSIVRIEMRLVCGTSQYQQAMSATNNITPAAATTFSTTTTTATTMSLAVDNDDDTERRLEETEVKLRVDKEKDEERLKNASERRKDERERRMDECERRKDEHERRKDECERRLRVMGDGSTTHMDMRLRALEEVMTTRWEERLRVQEEECEEKLQVQEKECEERLRVQKEEHEEAMDTRMKEMEERWTRDITSTYEERLRVQTEEHERALLVQFEVYLSYGYYYPLPLERFPLEIIALIADLLPALDDLARMSLTCHRLHNGVLLSRHWVVVEEIVAAIPGSPWQQKQILLDWRKCARFSCTVGLVRSLRALTLSRAEVEEPFVRACKNGQLEIVKYFHTTYALTADDMCVNDIGGEFWLSYPRARGVSRHVVFHLPVLKYLHRSMGVVPPREMLNDAARDLAALTFFHTEYGFTAKDVRELRLSPLRSACEICSSTQRCGVKFADEYDCDDSDGDLERDINGTQHTCDMNTLEHGHERLICLRDMYGVTKEDVQRAGTPMLYGRKELIAPVFGLEE